MSACGEVIDICYPVHLLNIILPFNSFDRNCFPPCQSQLVEGSRDWTSTGGQEYRNYRQRREGGGSVGDVWCDLSDSAGSAFKRGGPCDAVTLTESCYQLDSSEHEWLRKLLSGSEWRFIITTSFKLPPTSHLLLLLLRPVVKKESRRRRRRKRSEEGESDKSPQLMEKSGLTRWRGVSVSTTPTIWEPVKSLAS